jgi:cobalt-precorrin 5A hydrolase
MIAVGLGCRAGCPVAHVLEALTRSLETAGRGLDEIQALYTADFRAAEAAFLGAARALGKPLIALSVGELRAHAERALTRSPRVVERFGLPSVAETAALAGAAALGLHARLLGPRHVAGLATCALAGGEASGFETTGYRESGRESR